MSSKHEWRWKGPLGASHAEAFAEEIYLVDKMYALRAAIVREEERQRAEAS